MTIKDRNQVFRISSFGSGASRNLSQICDSMLEFKFVHESTNCRLKIDHEALKQAEENCGMDFKFVRRFVNSYNRYRSHLLKSLNDSEKRYFFNGEEID